MTDNPLANPQVMDWTTTKSKVLTELYRKTPQSGYSCDMIIIDDVIAPPPTAEQELQKMWGRNY
jgi:hypothetical protein